MCASDRIDSSDIDPSDPDLIPFHRMVPEMARSMARRFDLSDDDLPDLIQEGWIGVLMARESYDASRQVPFRTYAKYFIEKYMRLAAYRCWGIGEYHARAIRAVRRAEHSWAERESLPPTDRELADAACVSLATVRAIRGFFHRPYLLSQPIPHTDDACLADVLPDDPDTRPDAILEQRTDRTYIHSLIARLPPRLQLVICARYGIGMNQQTLDHIGQILHITKERVRQLEQTALHRLSVMMASEVSGVSAVLSTSGDVS